MTITVPTWTVVLPLLVIVLLALAWVLWWIDSHWVTPWIDKKLATRWGIPVEQLHAAREELRKRGEW